MIVCLHVSMSVWLGGERSCQTSPMVSPGTIVCGLICEGQTQWTAWALCYSSVLISSCLQTLFRLISFHWGSGFICFILSLVAKCSARPLAWESKTFLSFLYILLFLFFPCQAVTAVERGQGGMDSEVSVAHKLHLIGAWLTDRNPGMSQPYWAQTCTRIHWTETSPWQWRLIEWRATFFECFSKFLAQRLKVLELFRVTFSEKTGKTKQLGNQA